MIEQWLSGLSLPCSVQSQALPLCDGLGTCPQQSSSAARRCRSIMLPPSVLGFRTYGSSLPVTSLRRSHKCTASFPPPTTWILVDDHAVAKAMITILGEPSRLGLCIIALLRPELAKCMVPSSEFRRGTILLELPTLLWDKNDECLGGASPQIRAPCTACWSNIQVNQALPGLPVSATTAQTRLSKQTTQRLLPRWA